MHSLDELRERARRDLLALDAGIFEQLEQRPELRRLVEHGRAEVAATLAAHLVGRDQHVVHALPVGGGGVDDGRPIQHAQLLTDVLVVELRALPILVWHRVPLVDDDDAPLALLFDALSHAKVLLRHALHGVDHQHHHVRLSNHPKRPLHCHHLRPPARCRDGNAPSDLGRVDYPIRPLVWPREVRIDRVPHSPAQRAHNRPLLRHQRVCQAALAHIRSPHDGDSQHPLPVAATATAAFLPFVGPLASLSSPTWPSLPSSRERRPT